ncbi:c-type cytochrome [Falsiroseomonas selenitidurans]|uniref:Cytochrome c n=1 Tax=Falsiroseomonas selenitidurans TaxID=2716335 RepID=A0ABX1E6N7_9PROT|nr:cytochrome c [Falsiroseomonas selenitidurans]NKC32854.1 cytochrome c [Falsiroseomonas selenitidurans]
MRRLLPLLLLAACDGWPASPPPKPPAPPPPGAVAQGTLARQAALAPPGPPVTQALLARGADRYAIFCTPCHGPAGAGDGAVVVRGFPAPPPLPAAAGRSMAAMASGGPHPFADRLPPADRWAIARFVERLGQ